MDRKLLFSVAIQGCGAGFIISALVVGAVGDRGDRHLASAIGLFGILLGMFGAIAGARFKDTKRAVDR